MPSNEKPLYQRGGYWLGWDRGAGGKLRSPYLQIQWYDPERKRNRSSSTGTGDLGLAKQALDAHYLKNERGSCICPTCGQAIAGNSGYLIASAIADYMTAHGASRSSAEAIRFRLRHVLNYLDTLPSHQLSVDAVDEGWIERFRVWALDRPVIRPGGEEKLRSRGTVEASVRQLSAAINAAAKRGDSLRGAQFKSLPPRDVSRTPKLRATIEILAAMFAYATDQQRRKRCQPLHRFLLASVATLARPDAVMDLSTKPDRRQWDSARRVVSLNPDGRRQTKKSRPVVKAPWQFARWLDADAESGGAPFVPVVSVKHAWASMAKELDLPGEGEAGMKLIRRSMAQLLRDRGVPAAELEMQLGHRTLSATTDIYAPFQTEYLATATREIEAIMDEIEVFVPGAVYRTSTGDAQNVVPLKGAKNA